jgi:uncharacterized membrane protein YqaE (UPF0057 family)
MSPATSRTSFDDTLLYVEGELSSNFQLINGDLLIGLLPTIVPGIIIPPLVVMMKRGCGPEVLLNILLCFCAWIPGVIHAWIVIARNPSRPPVTAYDQAEYNL